MSKLTTQGGSGSSKTDPGIKIKALTQAKKLAVARTLGLYYYRGGNPTFTPTPQQKKLMKELFLLAVKAADKKLKDFYQDKVYVSSDDLD